MKKVVLGVEMVLHPEHPMFFDLSNCFPIINTCLNVCPLCRVMDAIESIYTFRITSYIIYYYETTGCENFIFQKSKIQNCVIKKMRGTYYYLLQRKNANIRGTVADHQVMTPDPICNLTMFYRLKQFWAVTFRWYVVKKYVEIQG